jgi:hypothetical protein
VLLEERLVLEEDTDARLRGERCHRGGADEGFELVRFEPFRHVAMIRTDVRRGQDSAVVDRRNRLSRASWASHRVGVAVGPYDGVTTTQASAPEPALALGLLWGGLCCGDAGVVRGGRIAPPGGGLERDPADTGEVDLGPGVGVLALHVVSAVVALFAWGETDGDP